MKHNNQIPNGHFHKDWQRYVRTWFDQPAKKEARRTHRVQRAKSLAPRPLHLLRPAVRGQTLKYNMRVRAGRGFTLDELKAAGISRKAALGVGIAVDHRRKNRSEESLNANVNRLKIYKSRLVIFPRKPSSQRAKKGDSSKEDLARAKQVLSKEVIPVKTPLSRVKARKITKDERQTVVRDVLRKALTDGKLWGAREKRAKDKAAGDAAGKGKKGAAADEMEE